VKGEGYGGGGNYSKSHSDSPSRAEQEESAHKEQQARAEGDRKLADETRPFDGRGMAQNQGFVGFHPGYYILAALAGAATVVTYFEYEKYKERRATEERAAEQRAAEQRAEEQRAGDAGARKLKEVYEEISRLNTPPSSNPSDRLREVTAQIDSLGRLKLELGETSGSQLSLKQLNTALDDINQKLESLRSERESLKGAQPSP
jgi:hypothetical protein